MAETLVDEHRSPASGRGTSSRARRRLMGAATVAGCTFVLGLAAWMTPSASGVGTHSQLNLPACGWINMADLPCMTCGMTTSFAHAVRGSFLESFLTQPFGFLLAMGTAMGLVMGLHVTVTGSNIAGMLSGLWRPRTLWTLAAIGLAAWAYKIVAYKGLFT